ncbi:MAG: hypothetical protein AAGK21_11595 [Bacteroidota bacterium]
MRFSHVALLAIVLSMPTAAQVDPVEHLATVLSLDDDQADLVAEVYVPGDPASVWTLAAELMPTLDVTQRDALLAPPERPERGQQGARGRRGARGGQQAGNRPERDPARAAVARASRDAALGLNEQESADLDTAIQGLGRRELMRSLREGTIPESVASLLSEEQVDLYRAQIALQRHLRRASREGRRGL